MLALLRWLKMALRGLGIGRKRGGASGGPIDPPAPPDTTPNAFDLGPPQTVEPDGLAYSSTNTLAGVAVGMAIPFSLDGVHGGCCRVERLDAPDTWTNIGTSGDLYLGNEWRVRTRALETEGGVLSLTLNIGGVTDTMIVTTETEALPAPAAPVLTQTSDDGAIPLTGSVNFGANNLIPPSEDDIPTDYVLHRYRVQPSGGSFGAYVTETLPVDLAFVADHLNDNLPIALPLYNAATFANGDTVGRQWGIQRGRKPVIVFEGDSNTASGALGFAGRYQTANTGNHYFMQAMVANGIADFETRLSTTLFRQPDIVVLGSHGANDLTSMSAAAYAERVLAWSDDLRAVGIKVLISAILPIALPAGSTSGNVTDHNTKRAIANGIFAAALGTRFDGWNPWTGAGIMADADATNTAKFSDGVHLTDAADAAALVPFEVELDALVATVPAPLAIVWGNEITDTLVVAPPSGVSLPLTAIAEVDRGYDNALYSTAAQAFGAGRAVVFVVSNNSPMAAMVLRPEGAVDNTTDITLSKTTNLQLQNANAQAEVWESSGDIAAGNYIIRVDPLIGAQFIRLYIGTLTGAAGAISDVATKAWSYGGGSNQVTSSQLDVTTDGLGFAIVVSDFASAVTFDNGTELFDHALGSDGARVAIGRYEASATPQIDLTGGSGCAILAFAWSAA